MTATTLAHPAALAPLRRRTVQVVVQQHAEEAAHLRHVRSVLVRAPHVGLLQLGRLDERIAAHLDGLVVSGQDGAALCTQALQTPAVGPMFTAASLALHTGNEPLLQHVLALVPVLPEALKGVVSALAWVPAGQLRGIGQRLLHSSQPHERLLGLAACRLHRVDPGPLLATTLEAPHHALTTPHADALLQEALRTAGALGRTDLLPAVQRHLASDAPQTAFRAAWSACLLGDRQAALAALEQMALQDQQPWADEALGVVLLASPVGAALEWAQALSTRAAENPGHLPTRRRQLRALGLLGQPRLVPWLIDRMAEPHLQRLAGECFSWITGADLARDDLETLQAAPLPEYPSSDPEADDTGLDEDESLPWPDVTKIRAWWDRQTAWHAAGSTQRLFSGQALGPGAAVQVLRLGTQRRRAQAALLRSLAQPGVGLFAVAAPAARQQRWLAQDGGGGSPNGPNSLNVSPARGGT